MGYLNACTFTYNDISSERYGLVVCWDNVTNEAPTGLEREIVKGETNMVRHKGNQYGTRYNNAITLDFMIMHYDGADFTRLESRMVNNWLMEDTYKILRFNDGDANNVIYKAICTNIEDRVYGGHMGKYLTFECDSPFAYSQKEYVINTARANIKTIFNTSDDGIYYPFLILNSQSNNIEIINETDSNSMILNLPDEFLNSNIIIDTSKFQVLDSNGVPIPFYKLGWNIDIDESEALQSSPIYWFRLLQEKNEIRINGNCTLQIKCEFPRKAGVL